MKKHIIPQKEQQNVVDVFWVLLKTLEYKIDSESSILDKRIVECSYDLLNRIGVTQARPEWESKRYK